MCTCECTHFVRKDVCHVSQYQDPPVPRDTEPDSRATWGAEGADPDKLVNFLQHL